MFAELGVVFLLFWVGLETRLSDMREVGRSAVASRRARRRVPFAARLRPSPLAVGEERETTVSSARRSCHQRRHHLGGADRARRARDAPRRARSSAPRSIDDILAMLLLAVAVGRGGERRRRRRRRSLVMIALALGVRRVLRDRRHAAASRAAPRVLHAPRFSESPLLPAVILCLGLAAFAAQIGLAAIIGAFLAGMIVAETKEQHPIEDEVAPLYAFFPPFFFAFIGIEVDLDALARRRNAGAARRDHACSRWSRSPRARGSARAACRRDGARSSRSGMVPRGEVGIIVAGIGARRGRHRRRAVRDHRRHVAS